MLAGAAISAAASASTGGAPPADSAGHKNPGPFCKSERATILGTAKGETINGTRNDDVIVALGGRDRVRGRGGNDLICGGGGSDTVGGGGGSDEIRGGNGDDRVKGGRADDRLRGNPGDDRLNGGPGDDRCNGGKGKDRESRCEKRASGPDETPVLPTAVDDAATVGEDDPATPIDVLANDPDSDGGPKSIDSVTQPADGAVVVTGGGSGLTYEPDPDYCNDGSPTDDFAYTLAPGGKTATVEVTVTCVNDPPTAAADSFDDAAPGPDQNAIGNTTFKVGAAAGTGPEKRIAGASLLDNDEDPVEDDPLSVSEVQGSAANVGSDTATDQAGTVNAAADGTFTYDPAPGFTGSDTFTYEITDGNLTDGATVTIEVTDTIWYVDSSAGSSADEGTSTDPFTDLRDLNGIDADVDDPAETIFLFQGISDGTATNAYRGMPLEANQELIGEPAGLTVDGTSLVAGDPGKPDISDDGDLFGTGHGVTLADDVMVDSVATVGTFSNGFDADAVGGFTLKDPLVRNSGGGAFDFDGITSPASVTGTLEVKDANTQGLSVDGSQAAGELTVDSVDIDGTNFEGVALGRFGANAGPVTISGGDVSGSGGSSATVGANDQGLRIDGGSANVTFDASIGANGSNSTGVAINGRSGGTVTIDGAVTDTGGGIDIGTTTANTGGAFDFNGLVDLDTTTNAGVAISNSTGATTSFDDLDVDTTSGTGLLFNTAGTVDIPNTPGTETVDSTTGRAIDIVGATADIGLDSTGVSNGSNGAVNLAMVLGTVGLGDADLTTSGGTALNASNTGTLKSSTGSTIAATGGPAVSLTSPGSLDLEFDSISSTNSSGDGVRVSGGTGGDFDVTGTTTVDNPSSDGIEIGSSGADFSFASIDIGDGAATGAGAEGVNLDSNTGAVSLLNGDIEGAAGNAFDVNGGSATVDYAGTIDNDVARAIEVTGRTGGSTLFGGAIDEDGTGINLGSNTGATITFNGGIDIDTGASTGFSASGGGTLNVCDDAGCGSGAARVNTIDTTTGIGLDLNGVAIGASDVTFRSISSNGAVNGIELDAVSNAGTVNVTGTGAGGSGGTIANSTAAGIDIDGGTAPVMLEQISIRNPADDGVFAQDPADLTLKSIAINDWGDGDQGIEAETTSGTGSVTIAGTAALPSTLDDTGAGGVGVLLQPTGNSTLNAVVNRTNVTEALDGVFLNPSDAGSTLNATIGDPGANDPDADFSTPMVTISDAADDAIQLAGNAGTANVLVDDVDTYRTSAGGDHGVEVLAGGDGAGSGADFDLILEQSRFGFVPLKFRHSDDALAIAADSTNAGGRVDVYLDNSGFGSEVHGADIRATDDGTVNATMGSNSFSGGGTAGTVGLSGRTTAGTGTPTACFDVGNSVGANSFSASPDGDAIDIDKGAGTNFNFRGLGAGTTSTDVQSLLVADNSPFVSGGVLVTGSGFGAAACALPTAP